MDVKRGIGLLVLVFLVAYLGVFTELTSHQQILLIPSNPIRPDNGAAELMADPGSVKDSATLMSHVPSARQAGNASTPPHPMRASPDITPTKWLEDTAASLPITTAAPTFDDKVDTALQEMITKQETWLRGEVVAFLNRTGITYGKKSSDLKAANGQWLTEYAKRMKSLTAAQIQSRASEARFKTKHLLEVFRRLELKGLRPMMRDGALIAALRHHGWIDFGGPAYQTGYDTDADTFLSMSGLVTLYAHNKLNASFLSPYTFKEYMPIQDYIHKHCAKPDETVAFLKSLEVDTSNPFGGTVEFNGVSVFGIIPTIPWMHFGSSLKLNCWKQVKDIVGPTSFLMLLHHSQLYPVRRVPFYNWTVPVAKDAEGLIKRSWGDDVMTHVRIKKPTGSGGSFSGVFFLERDCNDTVPCAPRVPLE